MDGKSDLPVEPEAAHPIDDVEMHALVDALRRIEEACENALTSGRFDQVQVMLMQSALQGSLNAKSAFSLWVQSVKKDLQFLSHWGDENTPEDLKPPICNSE